MRVLFAGGVLCLLLSACTAESGTEGTGPRTALTERCERALIGRGKGSAPRMFRGRMGERGPRYGEGGLTPLGGVAGAALIGNRLLVLDPVARDIKVYEEESGRFLRVVSGPGEGPGELQEVAGEHTGPPDGNQIATTPSGLVFVNGAAAIDVFEMSGGFVSRSNTNGMVAGPFGSRHIAAWSDSAVLVARSEMMAFDRGYEERVRASILRLRVTPEGELERSEVATVRTPYSLLPSFEGLPPRDPYSRLYRRTWDATPEGLLAVMPLTLPGVCVYDRSLALVSAYRLEVEATPTTRAVREEAMAILGELVPGGSLGAPETVYDYWPEHLPIYTDIVLGRDSLVWALRPTGLRTRVADIFRVDEGYQGTVAMNAAPVLAANRCGYWVEEDVETERPFYGLVRRCEPEGM